MNISDICDIPKNRPDYNLAYPGFSDPECVNQNLKLLDEGDQIVQDLLFQDYINTKGMPLLYYVYKFNVNKTEKLYGEQSNAEYSQPFDIFALVEIKDTPSWVTIHGFDNDTDATIWIHIKAFKEKIQTIINGDTEHELFDYFKEYDVNSSYEDKLSSYLKRFEPKPKDLFQIKTHGCDRPFPRGSKIYEITSKDDEIFSESFNIGGGHYVWKVTAKRYRYSYEGGMSTKDEESSNNQYIGEFGEKGNYQHYDNDPIEKIIPGMEIIISEDEDGIRDENNNIPVVSEDTSELGITKKYNKVYKKSSIEDSKKVFDMSVNVDGFYDKINDEHKPKIERNGYF